MKQTWSNPVRSKETGRNNRFTCLAGSFLNKKNAAKNQKI